MDRLMNSIPGRVVQKFLEDQAPNWAALIAWNTLFAMFPMVLFTAAILGFVLSVFGQANDKVFTIIFSAIPDPKQQQELVTVVSKVKTESGILFIVSLLFMLWGGSALFGIMEQAFAVIYHTKPRDFIPQKLVSFAMVLVFTVLVGIALIGSTIVGALKSIRQIPDLPRFLYSGGSVVLEIAVGTIAGFVLFLAIYYVIPNRKQQIRKVLPGAIVAAVLFEVTSLLFPLYLAIDQGIGQYGATFALLFILMTFFLLMGMITMVGVEVNSVLYPHDKDHAARGQWVPAAPETSGEARRKGARASRTASPNGAAGPVKARIRARTAVLMAVGASVIGLLVGRRSAGAD
ncbi:MAG TPA: YihY/virulence factor BrkB family protein [Candidatus Dormibacteraeota bacterium]